jgi:hypothetical protein
MASTDPHARREQAAAIREAIVLPAIFLTVALGGGVRVTRGTSHLVFLVPSLMALVLALLLLGALFRAGVLAPDRLMHASRAPIANLSGLIVLVSLFAAAAQAFNTATPEAGLLQFIFNIFFLLLLWNTIAARPDRRRLLHSLLVVFGGSFVLKYVVLGALYDPQGGLTKRVLTTMLEGVTLGGLTYDAPAAATGYIAFFTILLFLIGLILLPPDHRPVARALARPRHPEVEVLLPPSEAMTTPSDPARPLRETDRGPRRRARGGRHRVDR